ncbi:MAG: hypothetical protein EU549_00330 [Promethearchaeota archaeon]|nr:MAG: hypothetical protein EU549_00330 [Candidatus Lokiarchaeota archaeon]
MGFIRKLLWTTGIIIILITTINLASNIITFQWSLLWFILGGLVIGLTELYFYLSEYRRIKSVGNVLDEYLRITETQLVKYFDDKPAYKVLPAFRNYKKGLLVYTEGHYIHYNNELVDKFLEAYEENKDVTKLSKKFKYSKREVKDIIEKLKEKNKL